MSQPSFDPYEAADVDELILVGPQAFLMYAERMPSSLTTTLVIAGLAAGVGAWRGGKALKYGVVGGLATLATLTAVKTSFAAGAAAATVVTTQQCRHAAQSGRALAFSPEIITATQRASSVLKNTAPTVATAGIFGLCA